MAEKGSRAELEPKAKALYAARHQLGDIAKLLDISRGSLSKWKSESKRPDQDADDWDIARNNNRSLLERLRALLELPRIDYGQPRPIRSNQVIDETAAGVPRVETLAPAPTQTFSLAWKQMPATKYTALQNWVVNTVNFAANSFVYNDEYGIQNNVIYISGGFDFIQDSFNRYSGSIQLRKI